MMSYESIYRIIHTVVHYRIFDYPLFNIIGLLIPFPILGLSKLASSVVLKVLSVPIGALFFTLPYAVDFFSEWLR